MRILVTNDDGVESPGIKALASALVADGHDVTVFAPTTDRSGAGAAIGKLYGEAPPPVVRADWPDLPGVAVHVLDAPPATAVLAACLGAFGEKPELVASGINPGQNTGHLVLHSGTVGAALTAAGLDVPGLAVSLQFSLDGEYLWETAATFAAAAVEWVAQPDDGTPRVLNINVPNVPDRRSEGCARSGARGTRRSVDRVSRRVGWRPQARVRRTGRSRARDGRRGDQGRLRGRHAVGEHQPQGTGRRPGSGRSDRGRARVGANLA